MATVKTIEIRIQYADAQQQERGRVYVNNEVICEFDANDSVLIRNLDINADDGSIDDDKLHVSMTKDGMSLAQQRRKRLAKRFSLPQNKLLQLRGDNDKEVSKAMKQLLKNDREQIIISGIKILLNSAME